MRFSHILFLVILLSFIYINVLSQEKEDNVKEFNNEEQNEGVDFDDEDIDFGDKDEDDDTITTEKHDDVEFGDEEEVDDMISFDDTEEDDFDESDYDDFDDDDDDEELVPEVLSSPDVDASYVFPSVKDMRIPIGKKTEILFGFTNNGDAAFHVYLIEGGICNAENWKAKYQNFTRLRYNVTIEPSETNSMLYNFEPHPLFEPRRVGVEVIVYYYNMDSNQTFRSHFFNETLQLIEASSGFDTKKIFAYLIIFGVVGILCFLVYHQFFAKKRKLAAFKATKSKEIKLKKGGKKEPVEEDIDWEWLSESDRKRLLKERKQKIKKNK